MVMNGYSINPYWSIVEVIAGFRPATVVDGSPLICVGIGAARGEQHGGYIMHDRIF